MAVSRKKYCDELKPLVNTIQKYNASKANRHQRTKCDINNIGYCKWNSNGRTLHGFMTYF